MAKMQDKSGRNLGRHRDIISATDWEQLPASQQSQQQAMPDDGTNVEMLASGTTRKFWDEILGIVLGKGD